MSALHWLNTDDGSPPLVRAAMAHLHLVSIHPWSDGNGRMSRSLQTLLIAREGVLAPDQDVTDWLRFNLLAYHQQAQTVQGRWDRSAAAWAQLEKAIRPMALERRTVSALHDVAITGQVRRARYEQAEGLSTQQAQRDLRDLGALGVLVASGRTRARTYVAGPAFPEFVLETARTPTLLVDPYRR